MTAWDLAAWAAGGVLGLAAPIIFVAFLRDLRRLLRRSEEDDGHT